MDVLTGYYRFGVTVEQARAERNMNEGSGVVMLHPTVEKNNWLAKVDIPERKLAMKGAVGFLTDKFNHWYIIDWKMSPGAISFTIVKSDYSERRTFNLKLFEDGEYWGEVVTVGQNPKSEWVANCAVMQVTALSVPFDLPEEVLERPKLLN